MTKTFIKQLNPNLNSQEYPHTIMEDINNRKCLIKPDTTKIYKISNKFRPKPKWAIIITFKLIMGLKEFKRLQ